MNHGFESPVFLHVYLAQGRVGNQARRVDPLANPSRDAEILGGAEYKTVASTSDEVEGVAPVTSSR